MPAYDVYHNAVRDGLIQDGWTITAAPYLIEFGGIDQSIDIAAEKLIGAERGDQRIAVEIKSFMSPSTVSDFHTALGQYLHYRMVRDKEDPERILYLAGPLDTYDTFFSLLFTQTSVQRPGVHLIVFDPESEVLLPWIKQRVMES